MAATRAMATIKGMATGMATARTGTAATTAARATTDPAVRPRMSVLSAASQAVGATPELSEPLRCTGRHKAVRICTGALWSLLLDGLPVCVLECAHHPLHSGHRTGHTSH